MRRAFLASAAIASLAALGALAAPPVAAQARPTKPVRFIVPLAEQGFKGFSALAWWGIFAPAGTPKSIMDKFHAELVEAFNKPDVRKTLTEQLGMDLIASSPEAQRKWLVGEMQRWARSCATTASRRTEER